MIKLFHIGSSLCIHIDPCSLTRSGRHPASQPHGSCSGFTLVEILVAVMIFGILMTTLFSSFKSFILSSNMVKNNINHAVEVRNSLKRVVKDIESLYISMPPRYKKAEFDSVPDPFRFFCDEININGILFSRLRFASNEHIPLNGRDETGAAQIIYYVRSDGKDGFDLCRSDSLRPFTDMQNLICDPVVCRGIAGFEVKFFNKDKNEYSYWDSESDEFKYTVPCSLNIRIVLKREKNIVVETGLTLPVQRKAIDD
ncbi:MAG: type II secretion system protein [Thermodesulfobacteriota bacterium]|nr:type II secretion system protein [Thermodesulfobacteriota bacterium]